MERVVIKEALSKVHLLGSSPNHLWKIFEIVGGFFYFTFIYCYLVILLPPTKALFIDIKVSDG